MFVTDVEMGHHHKVTNITLSRISLTRCKLHPNLDIIFAFFIYVTKLERNYVNQE